jgi:hypothetical protein
VNAPAWLRHPLLDDFEHGFGTRGCDAPDRLVRARQVHGRTVLRARAGDTGILGDGDAVVSAAPGVAIGVVTADCLPILVATPQGAVAAIHAGWRGLAAGVIESALDALRGLGVDTADASAVVGPHVEARCYEVDAPVVSALETRFGPATAAALRATRHGHWEIALAQLAALDLERRGIDPARIAMLADACTVCDRERFHSYRRDGPSSGRLFHYLVAR